MFGYMRLAASDDPDENKTIQRELATYATREGFELERLFIERLDARDESAFFALVDALKTADVKNVIVPSLWHFARLPGLQAAMRDHIERELGARLWVIQSTVAQPKGATS
ncbi:recombinase family protein [Streptomyces scabiei]|uniref:recombinase family protein n=1 Tax=Streptomyces scabiei TaxID=1930 RepID=UPI001F490FD7|nr:recombinase family protein [Streptomyces scabiei]